MDPITGMVEKKVAESAWAYLRGLFTRNRDLKKQVEVLESQLAEERSGRLPFEKLMSELECRDAMYWKKDGSGGPYCSYCLHLSKEPIPLTQRGEGIFYCGIHNHHFETKERQERNRQAAQSGGVRRPSRFGRHSWMG